MSPFVHLVGGLNASAQDVLHGDGKSSVAVVVWLGAWLAFHLVWRDRRVDFGRVFGVTLALIGLGVLGTFPPFFALVARAG